MDLSKLSKAYDPYTASVATSLFLPSHPSQQTICRSNQASSSCETSISGPGKILGALSSLQGATKSLSDGSAFSVKSTASLERTGNAAATVTGVPGPVTPNITNGNNTPIDNDGDNDKLAGIPGAFNNANDSTKDPSHGLKGISRDDRDTDSQLSHEKIGASNSHVQRADAQGTQDTNNKSIFNSDSNIVSEHAGGLSSNLKDTKGSKADPVTDADQAANAVQAFVNSYNAAQATLNNIPKGESSNSSAVQSVKNQLSGAVDTVQKNLDGPYHTLSQVGITANANGTLAFNPNQFRTAVTNDKANVAQLFSNDGNGVAEQIHNVVTNVIDTTGTGQSTISSPAQVTQPNQQGVESKHSSEEIVQKALSTKYIGLEAKIGSQQATGEIIASQFAATEVNSNPPSVTSTPSKPPIIDAAQGNTVNTGGNEFAPLAAQYNVARGYY